MKLWLWKNHSGYSRRDVTVIFVIRLPYFALQVAMRDLCRGEKVPDEIDIKYNICRKVDRPVLCLRDAFSYDSFRYLESIIEPRLLLSAKKTQTVRSLQLSRLFACSSDVLYCFTYIHLSTVSHISYTDNSENNDRVVSQTAVGIILFST